MKKLMIYCFLLTFLSSPCLARDFIVEFVEEYYKEVQHQSGLSYSPFIYHAIHINFNKNSKLLVLTGKDHIYRQWLRQYIAKNKYFIVKVPKDEGNYFISSQAFKIDVANIHPLRLGSEEGQELFQSKKPDQIQSDNNGKGKKQKSKEGASKKADSKKAGKKEDEQKRLSDEKARKAAVDKKASEDKKQKEESEKERLAQEKELDEKVAKEALEEQKRREKADKELSEKEEELRAQAEIEAALEKQRREEADKRWLAREKELRAKVMHEALEERNRRKAANQRWLQRKRSLNASRYYKL